MIDVATRYLSLQYYLAGDVWDCDKWCRWIRRIGFSHLSDFPSLVLFLLDLIKVRVCLCWHTWKIPSFSLSGRRERCALHHVVIPYGGVKETILIEKRGDLTIHIYIYIQGDGIGGVALSRKGWRQLTWASAILVRAMGRADPRLIWPPLIHTNPYYRSLGLSRDLE